MAQQITHPFPPLFNKHSRILILGSFPSVKSREQMFFYGHKQNRFWKVIAAVTGNAVPCSIEEKRAVLLSSHIALWDSIASCSIVGSSDSSIKDVVPNDILPILKGSNIEAIFTNGNKSHEMYDRYIFPMTQITDIKLPSTSPANAAYSLERLIDEWSVITHYLQ